MNQLLAGATQRSAPVAPAALPGPAAQDLGSMVADVLRRGGARPQAAGSGLSRPLVRRSEQLGVAQLPISPLHNKTLEKGTHFLSASSHPQVTVVPLTAKCCLPKTPQSLLPSSGVAPVLPQLVGPPLTAPALSAVESRPPPAARGVPQQAAAGAMPQVMRRLQLRYFKGQLDFMACQTQ